MEKTFEGFDLETFIFAASFQVGNVERPIKSERDLDPFARGGARAQHSRVGFIEPYGPRYTRHTDCQEMR